MRREYVNAVVVNDELEPVGVPTTRLDLVQKRVMRNPKRRYWNGDTDDVIIAYRDVPECVSYCQSTIPACRHVHMPPQSRSQRVAANVRAEMARHGHTQVSLAKELDRTQQSLSLRLNGKVPFRVDELDRIAVILDVTLADLIGEDIEAAS